MSQPLHRVEKPWGYEVWWARTDRYVGKQIHINKGHALSLQYHNRKDETIFVWSGKILFERYSFFFKMIGFLMQIFFGERNTIEFKIGV